jgi:DNA-binding transcriptional MerR regulator
MLKRPLDKKMYYTIGELADALDVNASLIRFWEKEFQAIKPKKNAKGNRRFSQKDIQLIEKIYYLVKERGFTLEGAKTYLRKEKAANRTKLDTISKLQNIKAELQLIKDHL